MLVRVQPGTPYNAGEAMRKKKPKLKVKKISVEQRYIDDGIPCDGFRCPIAYAIRRQCRVTDVGVGGAIAEVGNIGYRLPAAAQTFIRRFDRGQFVKPFVFTMRQST
jgi:hypothetical protein